MLHVLHEGVAVGELGRCLAACVVLRRGRKGRMEIVARCHFESGEEAVRWGRERDALHVGRSDVLMAGTAYLPDRLQGWTDAEVIRDAARRSRRHLAEVLGKKGV